jgi:sugar phosphate isomerase/epimerase
VTAGFGASTFAFVWRSTALEALRELRGLGLDGFDVVLSPGHCWPAELSARARSELAGALATDGIRVESLNFPALDLNLASPVPEVRSYAVGLYGDALRLAADLGASGVVAVPGRVSTLIQPPPADSLGRLAEGVAVLLAVAEETGTLLHLELHPQTPIPTVAALEPFVRSVDHPRLRVVYDVANAELVGEDHGAALRRLAPLLGQVHLSDGSRTRWAHDRVGTGTVDFPAVLAALDEIAFAGARVLEVVTPEPLADLRDSLAALERLVRT